MNENEMIERALHLGYEHPMKQVDHETLKAYGKEDNVFLRFVDSEVHEYAWNQTWTHED